MLAESALETIPEKFHNHPLIIRESKRWRVEPKYLILDRCRHHEILLQLPQSHKRGRPDIIHQTLLAIQYSELNRRNFVKTYVHTIGNYVLDIEPETRIPKNYINFIGLMHQLFKFGKVPPQGKPLITLRKLNIRDLIKSLTFNKLIILDDVKGRKISFNDLVNDILSNEVSVILIGGFPHGEFSEEVYQLGGDVVRVGNVVYETWQITYKIITFIEHALNLE